MNGYLKILHIIFSFRTGGAETMLVDLANEQVSFGHDVSILIINEEIDAHLLSSISPQVKLHFFHRREGANPFGLMLRLNSFILKINPDIIHAHSFKAPALIRLYRHRMVYTAHCLDIPLKYVRGVRIAAISEAVYRDISFRNPRQSVSIIENGIIPKKILARGDTPFKQSSDPIKIVQVGRMAIAEKGQDILIKALAILRQRGINVVVTFIGDGNDLERMQQLAKELCVEKYVEFKGARSRDEIYTQLKDFDIMCHPSRSEGFGLTVAEGLAAGLPLAVPQSGGPREVAGNGRYCYTFKDENPESCANAVEEIIRNYPQALETAAKGREYVCQRFTIGNMTKKYTDFYHSRLAD